MMPTKFDELIANLQHRPTTDEYEARMNAVAARMGVRIDIDPVARLAVLGLLFSLAQPEFGRPRSRPRKPISDDEILARAVDRVKPADGSLTDSQVLLMMKAFLAFDEGFGKDADWLRLLVRPGITDGSDLTSLRKKVSNGRRLQRLRSPSVTK